MPDYSSILGNANEQAETLQANHRNMCRFTGPDDPNYQKVSGELHDMYRAVSNASKPKTARQKLESSLADSHHLDQLSASMLKPARYNYLRVLTLPSSMSCFSGISGNVPAPERYQASCRQYLHLGL